MSTPTILLAGGGSGGHISPGLAIAEAIEACDASYGLHFACSQRPIDADMLSAAGRPFTALPATPPSVRPRAAMTFLRQFSRSTAKATAVMREHDVRGVVLLGGFVAAPVARAARRLGIPTTLLNLDCVPGRANRWMRSRATMVLSAVRTVRPLADIVTGLPIRQQAKPPGDAAKCRTLLGLDPSRSTLVITGASQGATSINQLATQLAANHADVLRGWQVLHLSGTRDVDHMTITWRDSGVPSLVVPFHHEMGTIWGAADLVISRAGACSVAEIQYAGIPAIYLPYPHHRDMHQQFNAQASVDAQAAVVVHDHIDPKATMPSLLQAITPLLTHEDQLSLMQQAAQGRAGGDAARTVVRIVLEHLKQ
jgi:UDP-N-acetylglucosamine--N-acetylmuramyl-(pentapeptide) pyrophosphoryl-undecaprenol N-acetylglucosamine transferase